MSKGLAKILDSITNNPDQRFINRYLALIADIQDETEKRARALDLAATLVNQKSEEAMRIAHMVFKSDPENVRALDIIIASLEDRGSVAKAEVLKNERVKLVTVIEKQVPPPAVTVQTQDRPPEALKKTTASDFRFRGDQLENGIDLPINVEMPKKTISLSQNEEASPRGNSNFQYQENRDELQCLDIENQGKRDDGIEGAPQGLGGPTVRLTEYFTEESLPPMVPDVAGDSLPHNNFENIQTPAVTPPREARILENPPAVGDSDLGIGVELFDYYWQQGFVNQARDLLDQTAAIAGHESWWQARNNLLERSNIGIKVPPEFGGHLQAPVANKEPFKNAAFWGPINESLRLANVPVGDEVSEDAEVHTAVARIAPDVIEKISGLMRAETGLSPEEQLEMQWELCSALWGKQPDSAAASFIESMNLVEEDTRFWGVYLDGLIAGGGARRSRFLIYQKLKQTPRLAWANCAYKRLPEIWQCLGVVGFEWCEDDGVKSLIDQLSIHQPSSFVGRLPADTSLTGPPVFKL